MHITTAERFYTNNEMVDYPPKPCTFKVNDSVMFTNEYGLIFGPYKIIGFTKPEHELHGRFIHINFGSPWFPVKPESLTVVAMTHAERLCDELGITSKELNKFMRIVARYVHAWVHANNNHGDFKLSDEISDQATLYFKKLGLAVDWSPGLYPTVVKNGKEFHLPYKD